MPKLRSHDDPRATAAHETSVTERGSFASARCSCGWRGPARRSRDRARRDAREHTAG
ncbi:MAG: hypothetical protein HOY69_03490 [Streptomyces sp.]|nr:hypothetical protein [Streptomyces sp.]